MNSRFKWAFIGIEDHTGVMNVGGRLGADKAPQKVFESLKGFSGGAAVLSSLADQWSVNPLTDASSDIYKDWGSRISKTHSEVDFTVVVGGGHDHGYTQLLGVKNSSKKKSLKLGCINVDAHFDLRSNLPKMTSGSPFFAAIESKTLDPKRFVEFGIQTQANSNVLFDYAKKNKIQTVFWDQLRLLSAERKVAHFRKCIQKLCKQSDEVVLSFDLDSVEASSAPGVSAPSIEGFSASEAIALVVEAARHKKVRSLGLFEVNPLLDQDQRTSKLGALMIEKFARIKLGLDKK